ncbi:MAG: aminodeoxychorismate lyase [Gammaproteobacteria bacterium]|nr:aminodeoxychorismate lyase [Gammaproteobacteria bacterium]
MAQLSSPACLIDGQPQYLLEVNDRGLAYGDGVFETIAIVNYAPALWQAHMDRLSAGCRQLGFSAPAQSDFEQDLAVLELPETGVLKLIVTRGTGGRGYAPPEVATPRRILQIQPSRPALEGVGSGIAVRWCKTRLAPQPALAGIKHLNRLEQVLARQECQQDGTAEGLMCDVNGDLVEATAGNLIVEQGGEWIFPMGADCGVSGVMQSYLERLAKQWNITVNHRVLNPQEIDAKTAIYICNSLIGAVPVRAIGNQQLAISRHFERIRAHLIAHELIAA